MRKYKGNETFSRWPMVGFDPRIKITMPYESSGSISKRNADTLTSSHGLIDLLHEMSQQELLGLAGALRLH